MSFFQSYRLSILKKLFILLVLLGVSQSYLLFSISHEQMKENLISSKKMEMKSHLISVQEAVVYAYNNRDSVRIESIISSLHGDITLDLALFVDENGMVQASTKRSMVGSQTNEVLSKNEVLIVLEKSGSAKSKLMNVVWSNDDLLTVHAISPVVYNKISHFSLRTESIGMVYMRVNLTEKYAASYKTLMELFVLEFVLVLAFSVLLTFYFYSLVIKRLNVVNRAAGEVSRMDKEVEILVTGNDEISDLFLEFNSMSKTLFQQNRSIYEQEKKLLRAQQISHLGSWEYGVDNEMFYCSAEACRLLWGGAKSESISAKDYLLHFHEESIGELEQAFNNMIAGGVEGFEMENKLKNANKAEDRYVFHKCVCERTPQGGLLRCYGFLLDISDRKKSEHEMRANSRKFVRWKESNFIGIIQSSGDGRILDANKAMLEMVGYEKEDIESGILNWKAITPPEFIHLDNKAIEEAAENGYWAPFEKEYIHKDGHRVSVILGGALFETSPAEYIVFVLDISRQKISEKKLVELLGDVKSKHESLKQVNIEYQRSEKEQKDILNFFSSSIILINQKGVVTYVNRATEHLFEYSLNEMLGKDVACFMPAPYQANHKKYVNHYLETGEKRIIGVDREVEALTKNGEIVPIRLSVTELPIKVNGERRFIGMCIDLRAEIQQQEEKRRNQKLVGLGNLAGGVAHDFNNLLAIINGYAELLITEETLSSTHRESVNEILIAGERGATLTKRLLGFSKGKMAAPVVVNISQLIRGDLTHIQNVLSSNIVLNVDLQEKLWNCLLDPSDLLDAVLNVAINARYAMASAGEFSITCINETLHKKEALSLNMDDGEYIKLCLKDSGQGMDVETLEQIFDPFFSTKGEAGTGLGLSQVYGFVQRMKGHIKVESVLGRGSCFHLYFPRYEGVGSPQEISNSVSPMAPVQTHFSILVVDDERALQQLANSWLEQAGYRMFSASSGEQALLILRENPIDLVLSDVIMGGMNGYALYSYVHEHYPKCKFLLMSGFDDEIKTDGAEKSLQNNLLHKPYSRSELLKKVQLTLG